MPAGLIGIGQGRGGWDLFSKYHQDHHNKIADATKTMRVVIDPLNLEDNSARLVWLLDHNRSHQLINRFFGTTGPDLSELDFNDQQAVQGWVELNSLDHSLWDQVLAGLG